MGVQDRTAGLGAGRAPSVCRSSQPPQVRSLGLWDLDTGAWQPSVASRAEWWWPVTAEGPSGIGVQDAPFGLGPISWGTLKCLQ